jgi:hypothetical protein
MECEVREVVVELAVQFGDIPSVTAATTDSNDAAAEAATAVTAMAMAAADRTG